MQKTDELVNTLVKAVSDIQNKKAKGYDTQAQVTRVDGNTAYVHIPGGVDETPAQLTINAKKGDTVRVRVAGGTAWLVGNASNPPTDDATANAASAVANTASTMAGEAVESANIAQEAAESAQASAAEAKTSANEAKTSAIEANNHANSALTQLGFVEDVVDTLNWITAHGIYVVTSDTEVEEGKYYFEATQVTNPTGNPREQNYFEYNSSSQKYALSTDTTVTSGKTYYTIAQVTPTDPTGYLELDSVDDAVATYVQSHLALTDEGLYVLKDNDGYKLLVTNSSIKIFDPTGRQCFLADASALQDKPTVYGKIVRFRQDTMTNYLIYYFDEIPDADAVLYVEAFTGTEDAVAATSLISTLYPLSDRNPNNYMRILRSTALSYELIDYDYDSSGSYTVPLYVRYVYSTHFRGGTLKIGTATFDYNTAFGVSGSGTTPAYAITANGIHSYKGSQYPIIYNPVTNADVKKADTTLTASSTHSQWLTGLLKALCTAYPNQTGARFVGVLSPNSTGYYEVYIYDTSAIDDETGLPQYSFGTYRKYNNTDINFWTSNYIFGIADVSTAAGVGALPSTGGTITGILAIKKTTVGTNTYADANPKIMFQNAGASQNISLTFTDYDSIKSPASLTLNGNQGGEWFIAPNIYVSDTLEVGNGGKLKANGNALQITGSNSLELQGYNVRMSLDTSASSGVDHDLYAAINALGWASTVID